jgi:hypothetical protein
VPVKTWDMAPEPNKPKAIQVEDLKGELEKEHPVDLADVSGLFDTIIRRLDAAYGKVAGAMPDGASDEDREWRHANRVSQVEQASHALWLDAVERYKAR